MQYLNAMKRNIQKFRFTYYPSVGTQGAPGNPQRARERARSGQGEGADAEGDQGGFDGPHLAAQGGGLVLSSSNSIHSAVKPGNYLAMWNAIRMYGRYPLQLEGWSGSGAIEAFS